MSIFLSRTSRKILDYNLDCLIRMDPRTPSILDDLVLEFHDHHHHAVEQISSHRYFKDLFYSILKIMDAHTPKYPSVAGNSAYLLGAFLNADLSRQKVIEMLKNEERLEDVQHVLPNLAALIETFDLEAMTNASGTASLIFECDESRDWALQQPSCKWLIYILAKSLHETDMWVASNCALSLARICMCAEGKSMVMEHTDSEFIITNLILSVGVDNEGRGMNSAFAVAYLCEEEDGLKKIAYMKEILDLNMGLINMLRSVDEGCRKNALFCLKTISGHKDGKERLNDDPDIEHLLRLLCNSLTCGEEDLGKMASTSLMNLAESKEGYMLQKDHSSAKQSLQHVLTNMNISEDYRASAFEAMKSLMLPKPDPPVLKVMDAYSIQATWDPIEAKSENEVHYELYCGDKIVYSGPELSYTTMGLKERTDYEFRLRAFTEDDEESFVSEASVIQTFRAISSPPKNLRVVSLTSSSAKIVWERPDKVCGNLKGYYIQEQGKAIHYEPVYLYHFASNLESDKEYSFEVCAVTQRGRGEVALINVRTLRKDYYSPSKPILARIGAHEIVVTWKAPIAPSGRINNYEVICNGKSIYFGINKRCLAEKLTPNTKYKFTIVAWTNEGRAESEPAYKRTAKTYKKKKPKQKQWKTKEDLMKWLDSKEEVEEGEIVDETASEDEESYADGDSSTHDQSYEDQNGDIHGEPSDAENENDIEDQSEADDLSQIQHEDEDEVQPEQSEQYEEPEPEPEPEPVESKAKSGKTKRKTKTKRR